MNRYLMCSSIILFMITIISKVAAFVVTIVFSYYYGVGIITDAYYAAGTIPNLINNSLMICALTLFVPMYVQCKENDGKKKADEFTSSVLNSFVIFNATLFILVCSAAPVLAKLVAPGFTKEGLCHTQKMICLLSMSFPITVATYTLNNLWNANQKYVLPAVLTLLNHILIIFATVIFAPLFGLYCYPFICTGAWVFQLTILYFQSRKKIFHHYCFISLKNNYFRYMLKQSVPVMITTAADQINLAADNIISSGLPSGSLSCLGYAHRIFNSINGIVTSTLLTIYYPIISDQYAKKDKKGLDLTLRHYFEIMLLFVLSITILLIGNAKSLVYLLLKRGAMQEEDILRILQLFIIYVAGLLFMSLKEFVTRLFYIIGNTRLPTLINTICVIINIILSVVLKTYLGIYGIAIATVVSILFCSIVEGVALIWYIGGLEIVKRHDFINKKMIMQIIGSTCGAMICMLIIKNLFSIQNILISIFITTVIYGFSMGVILFIMKNEYMVRGVKAIKNQMIKK